MQKDEQRSEDCALLNPRINMDPIRMLAIDYDTLVPLFKERGHQAWMLPPILYFFSLCKSLLCGMVSKALEKSKIAMSTWVPLSLKDARSCVVISNCASHECLQRNPCWNFDSMLCLSKCLWMWEQIICSIIMQLTLVGDTGR